MAAELHSEVARRLAHDGQRYSRGRRRLVDVLAAARRPLTIPEVLAHDRVLAQSSAYRNLAVLERAGVVQRVIATGEWSRFELAERLTDDHHHHLICARCGDVRDIALAPDLEGVLERELGRLAVGEDFELDHHRLDLVGSCAGCRQT